jgi:hypothetical protein
MLLDFIYIRSIISSQSFLHNRLGGLQVLVPGTEEWKYVKVTISPFLSLSRPIRLADYQSNSSLSPDMRYAISVTPW